MSFKDVAVGTCIFTAGRMASMSNWVKALDFFRWRGEIVGGAGDEFLALRLIGQGFTWWDSASSALDMMICYCTFLLYVMNFYL
jgi:hypothetical protein